MANSLILGTHRSAAWRFLFALGCGVTGAGADVHAQPIQRTLAPVVLERVVLDRWIHEAQHPGFVVFDSMRGSIHLRGTVSTALNGTRSLTLRLQNLSARLSLDLTNRMRNATVDQPPISYGRYEDARSQAEMRRRRLQGQGALLDLPAARLWEVPFVMAAAPLVAGLTWSDTLSFLAESEGLSEQLEGIWRNEVVGDTVVDGRTLPLVRTQAELRYRSRELTTDFALEELFETTRDVSGTLVGRAAVDTALGVRAVGLDSTRLAGTAVLRTGAGRSFSSRVRYERQRSWLLRDSTAWSILQDSLRAEQRRQDTGMLILPRTELEERLRAGDVAAADSLYARWRDTSDPNERHAIRRILLMVNARGTGGERVEDRLLRLRREAGDTAGAIAESLQEIGRSPLTTAEMLPYLTDAGRLWRFGILPRFTYVELANQLLRATPILEPDSTRWPCDPAVCRAVVAMLNSTSEPRLRDVALAGAFARDPTRWYERVRARADSGSLIARNALRLGHGVGATWAAAPQTPMPEPGAAWRTWLTWLGGTVRWEASHANAMRFYAARTGRDPVQELRGEWPPAEDSARLVIGTILRGMRALGDATSADLATTLLTGSAADREAAQRQLAELIRRSGVTAPDSVRAQLLRSLIDSIATRGSTPWPTIPAQTGGTRLPGFAVEFHGVQGVPVFVLDQELPEAVTTALPNRFDLINRQEWDQRPNREGGALITFSPTRQWDDFVSIGWNWVVYRPRAADEAPSGYAGGGSLILLRTLAGWRVVTMGSWIT